MIATGRRRLPFRAEQGEDTARMNAFHLFRVTVGVEPNALRVRPKNTKDDAPVGQMPPEDGVRVPMATFNNSAEIHHFLRILE